MCLIACSQGFSTICSGDQVFDKDDPYMKKEPRSHLDKQSSKVSSSLDG